jgi:hypothetical protein
MPRWSRFSAVSVVTGDGVALLVRNIEPVTTISSLPCVSALGSCLPAAAWFSAFCCAAFRSCANAGAANANGVAAASSSAFLVNEMLVIMIPR